MVVVLIEDHHPRSLLLARVAGMLMMISLLAGVAFMFALFMNTATRPLVVALLTNRDVLAMTGIFAAMGFVGAMWAYGRLHMILVMVIILVIVIAACEVAIFAAHNPECPPPFGCFLPGA